MKKTDRFVWVSFFFFSFSLLVLTCSVVIAVCSPVRPTSCPAVAVVVPNYCHCRETVLLFSFFSISTSVNYIIAFKPATRTAAVVFSFAFVWFTCLLICLFVSVSVSLFTFHLLFAFPFLSLPFSLLTLSHRYLFPTLTHSLTHPLTY